MDYIVDDVSIPNYARINWHGYRVDEVVYDKDTVWKAPRKSIAIYVGESSTIIRVLSKDILFSVGLDDNSMAAWDSDFIDSENALFEVGQVYVIKSKSGTVETELFEFKPDTVNKWYLYDVTTVGIPFLTVSIDGYKNITVKTSETYGKLPWKYVIKCNGTDVATVAANTLLDTTVNLPNAINNKNNKITIDIYKSTYNTRIYYTYDICTIDSKDSKRFAISRTIANTVWDASLYKRDDRVGGDDVYLYATTAVTYKSGDLFSDSCPYCYGYGYSGFPEYPGSAYTLTTAVGASKPVMSDSNYLFIQNYYNRTGSTSLYEDSRYIGPNTNVSFGVNTRTMCDVGPQSDNGHRIINRIYSPDGIMVYDSTISSYGSSSWTAEVEIAYIHIEFKEMN